MDIVTEYPLIVGFLFGILISFFIFLISYLKSRNKFSEIPLEEIIAALPGHVYWKDKNGIYLGCNDTQAKTVGFSLGKEIIGKTDYDLSWKNQAAIFRKTDDEIIKSGETKTLEEASTLEDGTEVIFLSKKIPLKHKGEVVGILGISLDITEYTKDAMTEYLQNIIRFMPGHVYWKNAQGIYLGCNEEHAKSVGFSSSQDLVGKTDYDLPWKDIAHLVQKIDSEIMTTGVPQTLEEKGKLYNGQEAIFLSKKVPLIHKEKIIGILGISFDITEQKKTEKELIDTKTRLDGMTLLGASIAHELRTPFANLNITTQTIEKKISTVDNDPQNIKSDLNSVKKEIKAALTFIDMLLLNINPTINEAKIVNFSMKECINHTLERYPFVGKQLELIQWDEKKNPDFIVRGEELLLIHLFFNLIKNALYYIAKARKGNIEIRIENHTVFFKDTGTGISPEHLPHIFKRFFSQTYHGAGVGLTFCKWVMDNLNGKITCESEEGHYTLFTLEFPNNI